jgi:uncharacterized protein
MSAVLSQAVPGDHIAITTNPDTEPFWQAAKERRLTACQCGDCGHFRMPPSPYCPECQSTNKAWPTLPGTGTVFSFAICNQSPYPDVAHFIYVPIVVDLDGAPGVRLVSNLVGVDPARVQIGMKVAVYWTPIKDGWMLPNFKEP